MKILIQRSITKDNKADPIVLRRVSPRVFASEVGVEANAERVVIQIVVGDDVVARALLNENATPMV